MKKNILDNTNLVSNIMINLLTYLELIVYFSFYIIYYV